MDQNKPELPNYEDNPFLTIGKLLDDEISVAVLADTIEKYGICTYDEYGRFVFANEKIKAYALDLLKEHHEWECIPPEERSYEESRSPMDRWGCHDDNAYGHLGWSKKVVLNFDRAQDIRALGIEVDETKLSLKNKSLGNLVYDLDLQEAKTMAMSLRTSNGNNYYENAANHINSRDSHSIEVKSSIKVSDRDTSAIHCAAFLAMKNLTADEVSITFVGDKTESGIGANNLLEITARGDTRLVALATIDLIDLHRRSLNGQGVILLGMAQRMILPSTGSNRKKISRLREVFRSHLGITDDPFDPYRKGAGWVPRFKIYDSRGAADERARREAERRTTSYEQLMESGEKIGDSSPSHHSFDSENDDADDWLKNNDPDVSA